LGASSDVGAFRLTPDGRSVVYIADQRTNNIDELFVVPIDGSMPARRLSATLIAAGDVTSFELTPFDSHVIYRADAAIDGQFELFSAPIPAGFARAGSRSLEPDVTQLTHLS